MDYLWTFLWIALAVVVFGVAFVATRGRRRRARPADTRARPHEAGRAASPPETDAAGADTIDIDGTQESAPARPDEVEVPADRASTDQADQTSAPLAVETPAPAAGRMERLRARLARSGTLGNALLSVLSKDHLTEEDWEEIEETLLTADVGAGPTDELMEALRAHARIAGASEPETIRAELRRLLLDLVHVEADRSLRSSPGVGDDGQPHPASILMVGVNGTGKTTTAGKLARILVADDRTVVLGAADTFRAAAVEQLQTWGDRVGVSVVRSEQEGADPASVAFDAVATARSESCDVVIVDTAGRLQNKAGLMDELGKVTRVVGRHGPVSEVLLVLDATTGQNGMKQAQVFAEVANVTGIVLTKLDGTAKGGIVIAVQRELGVPVKFVGLGEGPDDLAPFDPETFVDALVS